MTKNARDERVVSQFDNREKSRVAMGTLLRFAQTKIESGIKGDFPLDEISNAKEYFLMWKRKKPFENNSLVFGAVSFLTLFFFFTSQIDFEISLVIISISWALFIFLEMDKSKITYIREMIGDMSNLSSEDRDFYLEGLRVELWNIEKEELKVIFLLIMFLLVEISLGVMDLSSYLAMDLSSYFKLLDIDLILERQGLKDFAFSVGIISIITFFSSGIFLTKYRRRL
jgi:hypothetical protein